MLRQNWMAASENVGLRPRLPVGAANHAMSLSSQTLNEPRVFSAWLYSRQLVVLYRRFVGFPSSCTLILEAYQLTLALTLCNKALPYRASTTALDLLVDSTGIKFLGEGEWKRKKHGAEYRRQWRKVHLGIDAQTLEIRAIEVTDNGVGDAPMLPHLLAQIPTDEKLASVSADGAYDTKACHAAIAERGAQAVIPPRKNAQVWKDTSPGAQVRNQAVRACKRLGSRIWKKWSGYHRRSLVETKMHCFKRLGERVMARTFERQVTELHIRVALLNRFTRLGCPVTVPVA